MRFFLRLYARCEDASCAQGISSRLREALSQFGPQEESAPQRYWKMPELFEFSFTLSPPTEASFEALVSCPVGGWSHSTAVGERWAIWNRQQGQFFLVPEVSWAEVQLFGT